MQFVTYYIHDLYIQLLFIMLLSPLLLYDTPFQKANKTVPIAVKECSLGSHAEATVLLDNDTQVPEKAGPVNSVISPDGICLLRHMCLLWWARIYTRVGKDSKAPVTNIWKHSSFKKKCFIMTPLNL